MNISSDKDLTGLVLDFDRKVEVSSVKDKPVKSSKRVKFQDFKRWIGGGDLTAEIPSKKYPKEKASSWAAPQASAKYEIGDRVSLEEVFGPEFTNPPSSLPEYKKA